MIKKMGWIKSIRNSSTGVGATFENLIGIKENQNEEPDFEGIEIKTKRSYSNSYTTLFNCTPTGQKQNEIERLKNEYGYTYRKERIYKVLQNSVYTTHKTKIGLKFFFQLKVNNDEEKIFLYVYDNELKLIDNSTYWTFELLKEKLYRKLSILAFVDAKRIIHDNIEYFKYYKMSLYKLKSFEKFIELIEIGKIRITFTIGVFQSGKRKGETHDHGTSFNIKECDLLYLYELL